MAAATATMGTALPTRAAKVTVVLGPILDALGLAQRRYLVQGRHTPEVRTRSWATPSVNLRRNQPASWLNIGHDQARTLGPIVWLQRDLAMRCWAVAVTGCDIPDGRRYLSAETDSDRDGADVVITGAALVDATAQTGLTPVVILPGDLDEYRAPDSRRQLDGPARDILGHAAEHHRYQYRHRATALTLRDLTPPREVAPGLRPTPTTNRCPARRAASRGGTADPARPHPRRGRPTCPPLEGAPPHSPSAPQGSS